MCISVPCDVEYTFLNSLHPQKKKPSAHKGQKPVLVWTGVVDGHVTRAPSILPQV